jgi:hypothetical protein
MMGSAVKLGVADCVQDLGVQRVQRDPDRAFIPGLHEFAVSHQPTVFEMPGARQRSTILQSRSRQSKSRENC